MSDFKYKRVLLKLSGEALMGSQSFGIDPAVPLRLAEEIRPVYEAGVEVAVVVGGGNIYRGVQGAANGMDRAQGDNMGMLATVINALALQDTFEKAGMDCRVMSAIEMRQIAEPYIRRRAIRHLEKGRITIFAAGTGNPSFTTDPGAALYSDTAEQELYTTVQFPVPLDSAASRYQGTDYSDLDGDGNSDLQMSFDQDGEYVTYVWYWNTVRGEFMDTLAD